MDKWVYHYEHYNTFLVVKCCLCYQCKSKYIRTAKGKWLEPVGGASDWLLMSVVPPTLLLSLVQCIVCLTSVCLQDCSRGILNEVDILRVGRSNCDVHKIPDILQGLISL